ERTVAERVPRGHDLNAALVSIDPSNGAVRAIVGGVDYGQAQFDAATEGTRQPGSAFKTFTLVAALEAKHSVDSQISGAAPCPIPNPGGKPDPWEPENYEGAAYGPVTLTDATTSSVNCAYARLASIVGFDKVADVARRLGVATEVSAVPSLTLGTEVVTPLDMAAAYGTLAADGVAHSPVLVTEVRRSDGSVLLRNEAPARPVLHPTVARQATAVLQAVVERGTGTAATVPGHAVAGKTGTAQNYQDAWFVGYTRHLSTAVWMGNLHGEVPMRGVRGLDVTGGSFPARIFGEFMRDALASAPPAPFTPPDIAFFAAVTSLDGSPLALPPPPDAEGRDGDAPDDADGDGRGRGGKRDDD
ncbi:MAG TPA: penicillin-binding transpeptidase domain-containing protein, partial [Acidimicrobiales bacterium]